jgi:hypothetical protein
MLRALLIAPLLMLVFAAPARADHVKCPLNHYLISDRGTPKVENLRAYNLPRRTDGYAPRCLVAAAVVAEIQLEYPPLPRRLNVYGARWSGGRWRCSYPAGRAVCRQIGKPRRKVTMVRP